MNTNKLSLGIVGGGPKSWIGHVHRISARFDDKYEIVAVSYTHLTLPTNREV